MRGHQGVRQDGAPLPWCPPRSGPPQSGPPPSRPPPTVLPWLSGATGAPPPGRSRTPGPPAWRRPLPTVDGRLVALVAVAALVLAVVVVALAWRPGGRTVSTPFLSYTAPAGWTADPAATGAPLDAPALTGTTHGAGYDCGGEAYVRGYAAAALLPADASAGSGPADRAARLARWFATASYATADGAVPAVTVAPPRPVRVAGPDGPVDATVTEVTAQTATGTGCAPTGGTVLALAAPVSGGAALLLVAADAGGGPADPAPPDRADLDAVLASVRLHPA